MVVEQRVDKKRKIAESVWVHNVVTVRIDKVAGQCATPYTPRWPVSNVLATRHAATPEREMSAVFLYNVLYRPMLCGTP